MKTKTFIIAIIAISLLSFTLIKTSKSNKETAKQEQKAHSGFAMQDSDQF